MKKLLLCLLMFMSFATLSFASDVVGEWKMSLEDGVNYITFENDGSVEVQYASMWGFVNVCTGKYENSGNQVTLYLVKEFMVYEGEPGSQKDMNVAIEFLVSFDGNRLVLTPRNLNDKTKKFLKDYCGSVSGSYQYKKL